MNFGIIAKMGKIVCSEITYLSGVNFSYIFFHGKSGFRRKFRGIFLQKFNSDFSYNFHEIFHEKMAIFRGNFSGEKGPKKLFSREIIDTYDAKCIKINQFLHKKA
jgi:hypothetical protein